MKILLSISLFFLMLTTAFAQHSGLNEKNAQIIKTSRLILVSTGHVEMDKSFLKAVQETWSFCGYDNIRVYSEEEAKDELKKHKNGLLFVLDKISSRSSSQTKEPKVADYIEVKKTSDVDRQTGEKIETYLTYSEGWSLKILEDKKTLYRHILPFKFDVEDFIPQEFFMYGVSSMNRVLNTMDQKGLKSIHKLDDVIEENSATLKSKTLLIPTSYLAEKIELEDFTKKYTAPIKIVDYEEWKKAIINRDSQYAYAIILKQAVNGSYVNIHAVMDAQTGKCYGVVSPKVTDNLKNLDQHGIIDKKVIPWYVDMLPKE